MKSVTKLQLLILLLVNLVTFNACSNTNAENKKANTKNNRALTTEISPVSGLKVATKVQTEYLLVITFGQT